MDCADPFSVVIMTPLNWPVTLVPVSRDTGGFQRPVSLESDSLFYLIHFNSSPYTQAGCSIAVRFQWNHALKAISMNIPENFSM
jgi:hypothetical protein